MTVTSTHKAKPAPDRGTPVRMSAIAATREAIEAVIRHNRHVQWTEPRRAQYGNAWTATGTYFVQSERK